MFHADPLNESPNDDSTSHGSSSNVRQIHTLLEHLGRWTKDHLIANMIGDPSCFVSTRNYVIWDRMSTPTQCCDMGSDGYAYPMYDMFGIMDPNMQNEELQVRESSNGNLLWESVCIRHGELRRVEIEIRYVMREKDVREVFLNKCGSGSKRKLSRCRRNQMGNEPILALPEGADDFVVYYDARSKRRRRDVRTLAIEEAYMTKYSIHPGADTVLCGFRLTNRWLSIKGLQDCCYNLSYSSRSGKKITKDVIAKLPSLSSGYDAIGCSQWTD
ncbi:hypothetical protein Tco_0033656 [Tanacetum coccineum]